MFGLSSLWHGGCSSHERLSRQILNRKPGERLSSRKSETERRSQRDALLVKSIRCTSQAAQPELPGWSKFQIKINDCLSHQVGQECDRQSPSKGLPPRDELIEEERAASFDRGNSVIRIRGGKPSFSLTQSKEKR